MKSYLIVALFLTAVIFVYFHDPVVLVATQASATATIKNREKKPQAPPAVKLAAQDMENILKLIAPYDFKGPFFKGWRFRQPEKYDSTDIAISLEAADAKEGMFLWLTKKDNDVARQGQSKSFNIICIVENQKNLNESQKAVAEHLMELIRKNDDGSVRLERKQTNGKDGVSVNLREAGIEKSTLMGRKLKWTIGLAALVILALAGVFLLRRTKQRI